MCFLAFDRGSALISPLPFLFLSSFMIISTKAYESPSSPHLMMGAPKPPTLRKFKLSQIQTFSQQVDWPKFQLLHGYFFFHPCISTELQVSHKSRQQVIAFPILFLILNNVSFILKQQLSIYRLLRAPKTHKPTEVKPLHKNIKALFTFSTVLTFALIKQMHWKIKLLRLSKNQHQYQNVFHCHTLAVKKVSFKNDFAEAVKLFFIKSDTLNILCEESAKACCIPNTMVVSVDRIQATEL